MRSIDSWFDRFCRKHPRLAIPNLMMYIVIGTAFVYILDQFGPFPISNYLAFDLYHIIHGQVWRLITFIFIPLNDNPFWFILSLYMYWWIGSSVEREWGSTKFTVFYGTGVLLNILSGLILALFLGGFSYPISTLYGADYLNMSLFFSMATLFPDLSILLFFVIPLKAKWLAWVDAALFAYGIVKGLVYTVMYGPVMLVMVIPPIFAILNYFLFFWSDIAEFCTRTFRRAKHQTSRQTINFKQATRHAQQQKGYIHKCAVCGKTDTDYPDEEFRYCSKCNGYYCYCSEHIHNHVHIE